MTSDVAQKATIKRITEIALNPGVADDHLLPLGH